MDFSPKNFVVDFFQYRGKLCAPKGRHMGRLLTSQKIFGNVFNFGKKNDIFVKNEKNFVVDFFKRSPCQIAFIYGKLLYYTRGLQSGQKKPLLHAFP